jgi:ketosteroid isomerase-like protein
VCTLIEIAKTDKAILQAEGIDPVETLCQTAASEKNENVFDRFANLVAHNLEPDIAIQILEIAANSPNQSEQTRRATATLIPHVLKRKAAGTWLANNPNDPNFFSGGKNPRARDPVCCE